MTTSVGDVTGKVCLVTGGTSGIGEVTARELARQGAKVTIVGRNADRCAAAVARIAQASGAQPDFIAADLSSLAEVRRFAATYAASHPRLDILVNNAGGVFTKRAVTVDGYERTFALNVLAPLLLAQSLLPNLTAAAPSRIVNVSSGVHFSGHLYLDDLQGEKHFSGWAAYCNSKLAFTIVSFQMASRWQGAGVTVNAVHPGWVATNFGRENGGLMAMLRPLSLVLARSPEKGAQTTLYVATSPELANVTGRYFADSHETPSSAASLDADSGLRLWDVCQQLIGRVAVPAA